MDSPLTDRGLAQGQILAAHLRNPADCQILTSPQPRAALTAQIAFSEIDTTALPEPRQREFSVGHRKGLARAEIAKGMAFDPDDGFWWMDHAPLGEGHAGGCAPCGGFACRAVGASGLGDPQRDHEPSARSAIGVGDGSDCAACCRVGRGLPHSG